MRKTDGLIALRETTLRQITDRFPARRLVSGAILVLASTLAVLPSTAQEPLQSSNLPIIKIDTHGQLIQDEPKITVSMQAVDNGAGVRNHVDDFPNAYDGSAGIEYRGSSSLALFPKKSFALETRNADGSNLNVALLGLATENDWVLHGAYSDKSLMRNALAFHMARATGRYASRWRFVELLLNGEYRGVYVLLEKVKRDNDRVAIARIGPEDNSGDRLTGGYIVKVDKSAGAETGGWFSRYSATTDATRKTFYQYHYPSPSDITEQQKAYIQRVVDDFETVMAGPQFADSSQGYSRYVDAGSVIDHILLSEATNNVDAYRLSTFFYKNRDSIDGRFVMGPPWDFNLAFGNANYFSGEATSGFRIHFSLPRDDPFHSPAWWARFVQDSIFVQTMISRWTDLRSDEYSTESLLAFVDSTAATLAESQSRNFRKWPVLDEWIWPNVVVTGSWEAEVEYLKSWLRTRMQWIDNNIDTIGKSVVSSETPYEESDVQITTHPNPAAGHFTLHVSIPVASGRVQIRMYDALGRMTRTLYDRFLTDGVQFSSQYDASGLAAGLYVVRIEAGGRTVKATTAIIN